MFHGGDGSLVTLGRRGHRVEGIRAGHIPESEECGQVPTGSNSMEKRGQPSSHKKTPSLAPGFQVSVTITSCLLSPIPQVA